MITRSNKTFTEGRLEKPKGSTEVIELLISELKVERKTKKAIKNYSASAQENQSVN